MGAGVAYGVGKLIGFLVQMIGSSGFADWHVDRRQRAGMRACTTIALRWSARVSPLCCSASSCSALCSVSFFPPQNSDYSRVNVTLPPGSDAEADRGGR